jgi:glycosyltransferase involved in cell wall biosynthesis
MPAKILFIATEDWFFVSHFLPMARAAREMGMDVAVVARDNGRSAPILALGARFIPLQAERRSLSPVGLIRQIFTLIGIFKAEKPDIVHCIALKPIGLAGLAARLANVPAQVFALTGLGFLGARQDKRGEVARALVRLALRYGLETPRTRYLFENADDPALLGLDPADTGKVTIVGGAGIDPLVFMPTPMPPRPPLKIAVVARMLWSKGVDTVVDSVTAAQMAGCNVQLSLYGQPDPSNPKSIPIGTLMAWSKRPGITWHGPTGDVDSVWRTHHVAALASRGGEGLPRTLLEAAACGRPLLTTNVPGCRSFVRDGVDGFVVPPDDVGALTKAIVALFRSPALTDRMGRSARERVLDGYTERDVMESVKQLYASLVDPDLVQIDTRPGILA